MPGPRPPPSASTTGTAGQPARTGRPFGPLPIRPFPSLSSLSPWDRLKLQALGIVFGLLVMVLLRGCMQAALLTKPSAQVPAQAAPWNAPAGATKEANPEAAIGIVLAATSEANSSRVSAALANLRRIARAQDPEGWKRYPQQVERGVIALESADRNNANDWFKQAIADDPYKPEGWFGLAIASREDNTTISALAVAELVRAGSTSGTAMQKQFSPQLMAPLGIDPVRFESLKARALVIVAKLKGEGLAPGVIERPAKPVPRPCQSWSECQNQRSADPAR
jgi:hypothetical protein